MLRLNGISIARVGRRAVKVSPVRRIFKPALIIFLVAALLVPLLSFPQDNNAAQGSLPAAAVSARYHYSPAIDFHSVMDHTPVQVGGETAVFAKPVAENEAESAIAKLPVYFMPNLGRVDESVEYYAAGAGYNFFVTREGVTYAFTRREGDAAGAVTAGAQPPPGATDQESSFEGYALKIAFAGANPAVQIEGRRQLSTTVNYLTGNDASKWRTDIPTFAQVAYIGLYSGIDLTYQGKDDKLKYEFIVAPGADPGQIRLVYQGTDFLEVDGNGNLVITTPWGTLQDEKPFTYQLIGNRKIEVDVSFAVNRDTVTFTLGDYDQNIPLVIDPGLAYASFLGGSSDEWGHSIAVDAAGCAYVTGGTQSHDFPTTAGAYNAGPNEEEFGFNAFVVKLNQAGSELLYATFLGGSGDDYGHSIAVDAAGQVYVTGWTESADFPATTGAYDTSYNGDRDVFVAKLELAVSPGSYKVAYLPVKYQSGPQPIRTITELEQRAQLVEDYYRQQSYGTVNIQSDFIFDQWKTLNLSAPGKYSDQFAYSVMDAAIDLAGINPGHYDAVVIIQTAYPGKAFCRAEGDVIGSEVFVSDRQSFAMWAHELGHAIFKWYDYYGRERGYYWSRGQVQYWGLMGIGPHMNPPAPVISYNKVLSGWLSYNSIGKNSFGEYLIEHLMDLEPGDGINRYQTGQADLPYYIFEGRKPPDHVTLTDPWKSLVTRLQQDPGILIYQVEVREREIRQGKEVINFTAPHLYAMPSVGRRTWTWPWETKKDRVTLTVGEYFICDISDAKYTARMSGSQLVLEIDEHIPRNRNIYRLFIESPVFWANELTGPYSEILNYSFDLDLKVYTSEGLKVGMNHATGEYVMEIPGARTSGNIPGGGPEWVSVPDTLDVHFVLDSTPALMWMNEIGLPELDIIATVQQISVNSDGSKTVTEETIPLELHSTLCRIAGSDRYKTAAEVSRTGWPYWADTVLLARGDNFPDSLAGVTLAYELDAPILLTPPGWLYEDTRAEINRLGAGRVIILGGTAAVSADVEAELEAMGLTVERISGADRFETAAKIAVELAKVRGGSADTAFIAFGHNFPDALAAASYAAVEGYPILLGGTNKLPGDTRTVLEGLGIARVFIAGGPAVIGEAAATELAGMGLAVERIAGADRFATAVKLAEEFLPAEAERIFIATGIDFPDALAGAVLAARRGSGVLLVDGRAFREEPPGVVQDFFTDRNFSRVNIFGGPAAVNEEIEAWFKVNLAQ